MLVLLWGTPQLETQGHQGHVTGRKADSFGAFGIRGQELPLGTLACSHASPC